MSTDRLEQRFWNVRAQSFEQLEWARRGDYLSHVLDVVGVRAGDMVVDIGTGIGLVAEAMARRGAHVTALDISPEMLRRAQAKLDGVSPLIAGDLRQGPFAQGAFDKAVARMVFHHVLDGLDAAVAECVRWLRPGGKLVLSEGVPPHEGVRTQYEAIFRLKEERRTLYPDDLIGLLTRAGLLNVRAFTFVGNCSGIHARRAVPGAGNEPPRTAA